MLYSRWRRLLAIGGGMAIGSLFLTASGAALTKQASTGGGGGLALAKQVVAKAKAPVTRWPGPTTSPKAARGKVIGHIACAQAAEGCKRETDGVVAAARAIGWKLIVVDGQGDQQKQLAGCNSLIQQGVEAISLGSIDAGVLGDCMAKANTKRIKVISIMAPDPRPQGGLIDVEQSPEKAGDALAALVALDAGGKGNVALFVHNENPYVSRRTKAFKAGLKKYAPRMKIVFEQSVTLSQIGPPEQQLMQAFLQGHPKGTVQYFYGGFDAMTAPLVEEAAREGRTELKAAGFDGNAQNISFIRSGSIQFATAASALEWDGWAAVDQLNRVFQGKPLVKNYTPARLLTKGNLPKTNAWFGDFDYQSYYKRLWGVR